MQLIPDHEMFPVILWPWLWPWCLDLKTWSVDQPTNQWISFCAISCERNYR